MTANELLRAALALIATDSTQAGDYYSVALPLINGLLAANFARNNLLRLARGREELKDMPQLGDMGQTLPYEDELALTALPYGLASLLVAEDDMSRAAWLHNRYVDALSDSAAALPESIEDVYAGGGA